jgi:hypothetical protein
MINILIGLIIVPLILTILSFKLPFLNKLIYNQFDIPLENKSFKNFIKSKESWTQLGLMFTLIVLFMQAFIFPLIPGVGVALGGLFPTMNALQVPRMAYSFIVFGLLPIHLSKMILSIINVTDKDASFISLKPFALTIAFFLVTFLNQVVTPLELILTIVLFQSFEKSGFFNKLFKAFSLQTSGLNDLSKLNRLFVLLLFVFGLVATTVRYIPGYKPLSSFLNSKLGFFGESVSGLLNHGINVASLLLLPLAIGKSLQATTTKMDTISPRQGYNVGYILGVLIGLLMQNFLGFTIKFKINTPPHTYIQ